MLEKSKNLQQTMLGKLDVHIQKTETRPTVITLYLPTPGVKPETLELLKGMQAEPHVIQLQERTF